MRTSARVAAALLTSSVVVAGSATAASAETTTIKDKASDVISYTSMKDERGTVLGYADSVASGVDLRSARIKHTTKSVSVKVKLSRLRDDTTIMVSFRLDGASEATRFLYNTWEDQGQVLNSNAKRRCKVPLTTRSGRSGSITAVIKRSCLGNPKRLKASVVAMSPGAFEENTPVLADAISPTALRTSVWTKWLKAS